MKSQQVEKSLENPQGAAWIAPEVEIRRYVEMVTYGGTSSHLMVKFNNDTRVNDLTKQFMR